MFYKLLAPHQRACTTPTCLYQSFTTSLHHTDMWAFCNVSIHHARTTKKIRLSNLPCAILVSVIVVVIVVVFVYCYCIYLILFVSCSAFCCNVYFSYPLNYEMFLSPLTRQTFKIEMIYSISLLHMEEAKKFIFLKI